MNQPDLKLLAQKKHKETARFLSKLKQSPPRNLDREMESIHDEVFSRTDCLSCGNCCRTTGPLLTSKDVDVLSHHLRIKPGELFEKYLRVDEDGDTVFKGMPCPFLGDDNFCSVYEHRPKACREYPHTNRKKFYQINELTLKNVAICPAAYEIVEKMKQSMK